MVSYNEVGAGLFQLMSMSILTMDNYDDLKAELKDIQRSINTMNITAARMEEQVSNLTYTVKVIKESLDEDFVTQESFSPIKNFVYGTVAIIAAGFLGAVLTVVHWGSK